MGSDIGGEPVQTSPGLESFTRHIDNIPLMPPKKAAQEKYSLDCAHGESLDME